MATPSIAPEYERDRGWIDRVVAMMQRCSTPLLRGGAGTGLRPEGKSPLTPEAIAQIRSLYVAAARAGRVDCAAIASAAGVSISTVRNHTRDLRTAKRKVHAR